MRINKPVKRAINAVTLMRPDIRRSYKFIRNINKAASRIKCPPVNYTIWNREIKNGDYSVPVRVFEPLDVYSDSLLLFFHGGGWVTGNIDTYSRPCANIARATGLTVVSVDYRLAPEFKFPAGLTDCYAVAKEILTNGFFDIAPKNITIAGDSAGANIAAALSLMARDKGEFLPPRQILLYPAVYNCHNGNSPFPSIRENGDGYMLTSEMVEAYSDLYLSSDKDILNPYYAPLLAESLANQPDTLIITAEYDPLRDEGEEYGKRLKAAGNNVIILRIHEALHGFIALSPKIRQVSQAYDAINLFLNNSK